MKKAKLLEECKNILETPKVSKWYKDNMVSVSQYETINQLEEAVQKNMLTIREALAICLVVGIQWDIKFIGVS